MIKAQKTVDITNSKLQTTWKFTKLWTTTNEEVEAIFIGNTLNLYDKLWYDHATKISMTMWANVMLQMKSVWQCELMSCWNRNRYDIAGHCHAAIFGMTIHSMTYDLEVKSWSGMTMFSNVIPVSYTHLTLPTTPYV